MCMKEYVAAMFIQVLLCLFCDRLPMLDSYIDLYRTTLVTCDRTAAGKRVRFRLQNKCLHDLHSK